MRSKLPKNCCANKIGSFRSRIQSLRCAVCAARQMKNQLELLCPNFCCIQVSTNPKIATIKSGMLASHRNKTLLVGEMAETQAHIANQQNRRVFEAVLEISSL